MLRALSRCPLPAVRLLAPRSAVLVESVRGRKSRTDPQAKSKIGRIKTPPPVDPVEMITMKERYTEYNLILKALRLEFRENMLRKRYEEEVGSVAEERAKRDAEEHKSLMAWNDAENHRLQVIREQRVQKEAEAAEEKRKEAAMLHQQELENYIKEKERQILQLQEEAKNFITLDNLDQRIEEALDNPINYNFAIDKQGRVVKRTAFQ
ncbi:small ribosomal subunit protein mS26 [Danio rerio]|uniref:Small ribosomal subunit protein mS26 n=1 Tax=Danio rerio TaxID=7955 RepID=Q6DH29_DANRE|nr:28S ribosomal protein S26, mitochondrial [Danio rerio]AAH76154.1 Zgc:92670 [Danio rerio]CAQ15184.1 novel protein similar to vertebrate mitochondrial ribosomal protein S26 (MRPS26) [Danio rerio]|eukprot:NP_001002418.1 28S ribosomal protein S26, mitochondrial [Danio rerio]